MREYQVKDMMRLPVWPYRGCSFLRSLLVGFFLIACAFPLSGCGLLSKDTDIGATAADSGKGPDPEWQPQPVSYTTAIKVEGEPQSLAGKMEDLSQLKSLREEPPDGMLALERRARMDQETAVKLLHSQCYYDGEARIFIDDKTSPVKVTLTLVPGKIYTVGGADVVYEPAPVIPDAFKNRERSAGFWGLEKEKLPPPDFPSTVPGIEIGKPVIADHMLAQVKKIPENLRKTGYPLAAIKDSLYTLNKPERQLNARIIINPGSPALMGNVIVKGAKDVNPDYLKKLMLWKPGLEPWDDTLLQDYANNLRALGIFRSVETAPEVADLKHDAAGERGGAAILPVEVTVVEGPMRSVSASARYDTDTGFGVEGTWEHRNLFGNGEKLSLDAPISQQVYGLKAHFEKPAFYDRDMKLWADGAALWQDTDAYEQNSVRGELGLERRLDPRWTANVSIFGEGGSLKDNEHEEKPYGVLSPRGRLRYDGRNNILNPSSGFELDFNLSPFAGYYEESFGAFAGKLSASAYYAPLGRKNDGQIDNKIVLAGRVEAGGMPGASSLRSIPASLRYYAGGAGTVRGYAYQAIGPRDSEGDPLGGRSYQVVNLEARYMVTENIGIVPFLDGGMVYRDEYPRIFGDMDWGLGLGLRYYTPIGPVRLDVSTPLHQIDGDPPVQFYISIGQSF